MQKEDQSPGVISVKWFILYVCMNIMTIGFESFNSNLQALWILCTFILKPTNIRFRQKKPCFKPPTLQTI